MARGVVRGVVRGAIALIIVGGSVLTATSGAAVAGAAQSLTPPGRGPTSSAPASAERGGVVGHQQAPRTVVPGTWSISASPNISADNGLFGSSCVSAAVCMAVGFAFDGGGFRQPMAEEWSGTSWSALAVPSPSVTQDINLVGVSCPSVAFCSAVGYNDEVGGSGHYQPVIEQWNGAAWSLAATPALPAGVDYRLFRVSCVSAVSCMAVGDSYNSGSTSFETIALLWNGATWSVTANPSPGLNGYFEDVSCQSPTWCTAVGGSVSGTTLVERWNGTSWSVLTTPNPSTGPDAVLDAVSCPSTTFCAATGYAYGGAYEQTLAEQWDGTAWSVVPTPNPSTAFDNELWSVSCTGPTSCVTVGFSYTGLNTYVTAALAWNGTTWTSNPPVNPAVDTPGNDYAELFGVSCVGGHSCMAVGDAYPGGGADDTTLVETAPITRPGYRFVAGDGGVFAFGGASFNGSAGSLVLNKPVVGMAATPDGGGYWLVASDGGIFSYGDAAFYGSTGSLHLNKPIVGMASTPDGGGYWLVASDGGIFSYGDATFYGSTGSLHLNKPIVGMAATPSGHGYWLVASDGGVFSFGDAAFYGSTGSLHLNKPIVGMASTPSGNGYWLVASDGGIFAFGDAAFFGSTGSLTLNKPVVGMASTPDGGGYWLVAADGGVFSYGDAVFAGSTGSLKLNSPIVGMSA